MRKRILFSLGWLVLLSCLLPSPARTAPQTLMEKMNCLRRQIPNPENAPAIRGNLRVTQIDERNLCVTGSYHDFLVERFRQECGPFLKQMESDAFRPQDWSRQFHYRFAALEVIAAYRPQIVAAWKSGFEVKTNGKSVPIRRFGWWINPMSAGHFPSFGPEKEMIFNAAQVTHHLFIELESPMTPGTVYSLRNSLGEQVDFQYAPKNRSEAIQLNQVGTAADAGRKYAYLSIWRGPELGGADYSAWEGKPFFVIDSQGKRLFEGSIQRRQADEEAQNRFTGNAVWEMDFSEFCQPGRYWLSVPGIGRSWPFTLGNDAIGEAFYVRMRGMFQKRCGCAKEEPFTHWPGGACHLTTYQGKFPPNWRHYGVKNGDYGFFDADGNHVEVKPFDLIHETCTADDSTRIPNLSGGWHDAGDYDRRSLHLISVGDFVTAYLLFPQNFSDGQLNLPESGNGIPDLLDEAVWGAEVWRKAQNEKGGVGCWIEAESHPKNFVPETDEQPYFLALPTMESSAEYASYAAALALALHRAGAEKLSLTFRESALRAYHFAQDPANRQICEYPRISCQKDGKRVTCDVTYRESEKLSGAALGKAALNFFFLTENPQFLEDFRRFRPLGFDQAIREMSWNTSPFWCAELIAEATRFLPDAHSTETHSNAPDPQFRDLQEVFDHYRTELLKLADVRLQELDENYPIRMPWYASRHAYVSHMSWGNFHPLNRAKPFIAAWRLTGDVKYRDAALLANDWQLGANPAGSSMTTGLGRNYPVRFLDLPSYQDGIEEFIPGISPYRYVFGQNRCAVETGYGLYVSQREDHGFQTLQIPLALPSFPSKAPQQDAKATKQDAKTTQQDAKAPQQDAKAPRQDAKAPAPQSETSAPEIGEFAKAVAEQIPILHRFGNVEGWSVAASEFTVWETVAPGAAVTGCLLEPGWLPDQKLKDRKPANDLKKLQGYWALP